MNKELSLLTIIRLDTELENALGHYTHALKNNDLGELIVWDNEIASLLNEIEFLGEQE